MLTTPLLEIVVRVRVLTGAVEGGETDLETRR